MTLNDCVECGNQVSTHATECPKCGARVVVSPESSTDVNRNEECRIPEDQRESRKPIGPSEEEGAFYFCGLCGNKIRKGELCLTCQDGGSTVPKGKLDAKKFWLCASCGTKNKGKWTRCFQCGVVKPASTNIRGLLGCMAWLMVPLVLTTACGLWWRSLCSKCHGTGVFTEYSHCGACYGSLVIGAGTVFERECPRCNGTGLGVSVRKECNSCGGDGKKD